MKWLIVTDKYGLLDEPVKTFLNTNHIVGMKYISDQGLMIKMIEEDSPYLLPCSISVGNKLINEIVEFTSDRNKGKNTLDIETIKGELMKQDNQVKHDTLKVNKATSEQTILDF